MDANLELGLPADAREYSAGAQILADLGVRSVRLLTNNPEKVSGLSAFGVEVTGRVPLPAVATPENLRYLMSSGTGSAIHRRAARHARRRKPAGWPCPVNAVRSGSPARAARPGQPPACGFCWMARTSGEAR